jgi:hypothetical protein
MPRMCRLHMAESRDRELVGRESQEQVRRAPLPIAHEFGCKNGRVAVRLELLDHRLDARMLVVGPLAVRTAVRMRLACKLARR